MNLSHMLRSVVIVAGLAVGMLAQALPASAASGLTLSMTAAPEPVASGGTVTYTLRVANPQVWIRICGIGPNGKPFCYKEPVGTDVSGVSVSFQSVSGDSGFACSQSAGTVSCNGGYIAAGSTATISIGVTAPTLAAGGSNVSLMNSASVTPGGATAATQTTVTAPALPTLSLRARIQGPTSVAAYQTATYQVFVDNLSSVSASNIETLFQTALPAQAVSGLTSPGWGCFIISGFLPRLGIDCSGGSVGAFGTSGWWISFYFKSSGCGGVSVLLDPNNTLSSPKNLTNATLGVCAT